MMILMRDITGHYVSHSLDLQRICEFLKHNNCVLNFKHIIKHWHLTKRKMQNKIKMLHCIVPNSNDFFCPKLLIHCLTMAVRLLNIETIFP